MTSLAKYIAAVLWSAAFSAQMLSAAIPVSTGKTQRSVGLFSSVKGVGVSVDAVRDEGDMFSSFAIYGDLYKVIEGEASSPGLRACFASNFIVRRFEGSADVTTLMYVGPGVSAGWIRDRDKHMGVMASLYGNAGLRFCFNRGISISAEIGVDVGVHVSMERNSELLQLGLYKNGIYRCFWPQLRINYDF